MATAQFVQYRRPLPLVRITVVMVQRENIVARPHNQNARSVRVNVALYTAPARNVIILACERGVGLEIIDDCKDTIPERVSKKYRPTRKINTAFRRPIELCLVPPDNRINSPGIARVRPRGIV